MIRIGEITSQWSKAQRVKTQYLDSVPSTNTFAKDHAFTQDAFENEVLFFVTDQQTQGRGRFDRTWKSGRNGAGLTATWSFLIEEQPHPIITSLIGLSLFQAARNTWGFLPWSLKAPNDIFLGDKKVAGVLVETVSQGDDYRLIVGVGFNVMTAPSDVDTSTYLLKHLSDETPLLGEDWITFLDRFLMEMTFVVGRLSEELSPTQKHNLLSALNLYPHLEKKYSHFSEVEKTLEHL